MIEKVVWNCCTASLLEDFGGSQDIAKSWRAIPISCTLARLICLPSNA